MRTTSRLLSVLILAAVSLAVPAPAGADHASAVEVQLKVGVAATADSPPTAYTTVRVRMVRDGWGMKFRPLSAVSELFSTADRICYYLRVQLNVAQGPDKSRIVGPVCDQNERGGRRVGVEEISKEEFFKRRTLNARAGLHLRGAEVKLCAVLEGAGQPQKCVKETTVLPDHTDHATGAQIRTLERLMGLSLREFMVRRERGGGSLDWREDGCSAPGGGTNLWNRRFRKACVRHDFAYRNFGAGTAGDVWANPTDQRRKWADKRFMADLLTLCALNTGWGRCERWAVVYYDGVRMCGATGFYREKYEACLP